MIEHAQTATGPDLETVLATWEAEAAKNGRVPFKKMNAFVDATYPAPDPADVYYISQRIHGLHSFDAAATDWIADAVDDERKAYAAACRGHHAAPGVSTYYVMILTKRLYDQAQYSAQLRYLEVRHAA